ncbi:AsnC family transcriptional regulator [Streptomyces sp. B6B3]|uniref:Lrp/AsnC family transcriptional regulator n=1 Tax=Streptomyces sp. B6B3 TaxID=3153570 RepID=UPI00325C93E1
MNSDPERGTAPEFDELDRRVVHALQLDARASFTRIAGVLGVSDQTVARRYTRLRSAGRLRVVALPSVRALGESWWTVRLECVPGAAEDLARALAHRADTLWVSLVSAGTEIAFAVRGGEGGTPLLDRLPRTRQVVRMTAHCHLHTFFGGPLSLVNKLGALTEAEVAELRWPVPDGPESDPVPASTLTEEDRRLVAPLTRDGRASVTELAAATGWSQTSVRRRLAELRAGDALFFDIEYDWRVFGLAARAALWLSVAPARLAETGEALAGHPEVAFCAATTGTSNLFAVAVCADIRALYTYLTTRIAALPAVRHMETAPLTRVAKGVAPPDGSAGARPRSAGAGGAVRAGGSAPGRSGGPVGGRR